MDGAFQGTLFADDFLRGSIELFEDWQELNDEVLNGLESELHSLFERFPTGGSPNESQTEDDLIWPVLDRLGWRAGLRQQNLSQRGREDVPDGLLFADDATKQRANGLAEEWRRYEFGLAVVESKRWLRPLDRRSGHHGEGTAPSTQMLRYVRRVDDLTTGRLRWGILTNGAHWRLYYAGAPSMSEQFFEISLAGVLNVPGHNDGLFALTARDRRHWLRVFAVIFGRQSFLPGAVDERTFHQRAIEEGRFYQKRVSDSLSQVVFDEVFPNLACALAEEAPEAPLQEVRDAALVLLYRLLFILYAEDRNLLPVRDDRYDDYALRDKVRSDIGRRKDHGDVFSDTAARYWSMFDDLCRVIDSGDASIGLPPYNGGLFDQDLIPWLSRIRLGDATIADVVDALSFERTPEGRRYINYRDLGVQQLGSIYERLLEQEIVRHGGEILVRLNVFARKDSGSYYTPDDLVALIIEETIEPLARARTEEFASRAVTLAESPLSEQAQSEGLKKLDPAERILDLRVCDPAMGSGHFLVNLVDHLAELVLAGMAEAEATVDGYISPLTERIDAIRSTIIANAEELGWTLDPAQLDDRHIVRRMVLKRCVYGVDKNPMAVELAKVSLWLHTFTVGAPLSFLDHHLVCGDSLFGAWVRPTIEKAEQHGALFLSEPVSRATAAATPMEEIEGLTDAEIAEAYRSAETYSEIAAMTSPLNSFLSLLYAFEWLGLRNRQDQAAYFAYLDGVYGDPVDIAQGTSPVQLEVDGAQRFVDLLGRARELIAEERFLNWQVRFPGVWTDWNARQTTGGFDAVIGNPPWDRVRLEQKEWFGTRRREIAMTPRAADRRRMIARLENLGDPLADDFAKASERAAAATRMARRSGDYPLLSAGDVNLYSLFVERAMTLVKPDGIVGLLVPSGIASDHTAARFFRGVATERRLKALYDFENRRTRFPGPPFFPDIDGRFKFCVFVASPFPLWPEAQCGFFLHDVTERDDPEHCFPLSSATFAQVNPNTGTAPIFRSHDDATLTARIYEHLPVLVNRSSGEEEKAWPVKYTRMFDMTNDSGLFRTRHELLDREGAWPIGRNIFRSCDGEWMPLYEGKMVQAFDHRAASVVVNLQNQRRPAQRNPTALHQHQDPEWVPDPRFWVLKSEDNIHGSPVVLGFKHVTSPTNARSMIATLLPPYGAGNSLPLLLREEEGYIGVAATSVANLNSIPLDFVVRQKVQGQNLNLFILEQLPVVPLDHYEAVHFGPKSAGEIVRTAVLELTYTSHDMAPFAQEMGHLDRSGDVLPPFIWDEERRLDLRAKLDAVFFHLYNITDPDDVRYIYSTFPIVQNHELEVFDTYRSRDLCLAWINALAAGEPDAEIEL